MPNFDDEGGNDGAERGSVSRQHRHVDYDDIGLQEAGHDNGNHQTHAHPESTAGDGADFKSYAPEESGSEVDESGTHPSRWDARDKSGDTNDSSKRLNPRGKDEDLAPTPSVALAPTQSVQVGEVRDVGEVGAHKVVKKKTYLHRSHKMYSERIQRHTFLMKTLAVWQNIWTMVSTFPYWDMAFWSGYVPEF